MLKIQTIPVGMLQTNCYLLWQDTRRDCVIVDPGDNPRKIMAFMEQADLSPAAILLTHGHFDHDGAVKDLAMEFDCPVYMNKLELALPSGIPTGRRFYTHTCAEGDVLEIAGISFRVLGTPGHTPGSVCFVTEDVILSGDTLFAGACGRTDFPCGSFRQILESLNRLASLEGDYTVYPGHGESTTLSAERMYNPYMK